MIDIEEFFSVEKLESYFKEKILESSGKGIDGVSAKDFESVSSEVLERASRKVLNSNYRFTPYLEIIKSKGRGKEPRVISKPVIRDKVILYAIKEILHELYPNSVPNKLPNTIVREIKDVLESFGKEDLYYLKVDVKGFYDNLCRGLILEKIGSCCVDERFITIVRRAISNKTVPKNYKKIESEKYLTETGVPQGLSISNILAEIYMEDFDSEFESKGKGYFRYVDDILIFADKKDILNIEKEIYEKLEEISLCGHEQNQEKKSEKGLVSYGFQYLGYEISSSNVSVRRSTVDRYIDAIISMFVRFRYNADRKERESKFLKIEQVKEIFILELNEKITGAINDNKKYGWIFYFIEIDDLKMLYCLDAVIRKQFERLDLFDKKAPDSWSKNNLGLCSMVRAYYEIKYNLNGGYIHDYNQYVTREQKLSYLVKFGYVAPYGDSAYTDEEINLMFISAKSSKLLKLEDDVGNIS